MSHKFNSIFTFLLTILTSFYAYKYLSAPDKSIFDILQILGLVFTALYGKVIALKEVELSIHHD